MTITDQIIEMSRRANGVSSTCMPEIESGDMSARCCELVRRGKLLRGGKVRGKIRYFATKEAAQAYDLSVGCSIAQKPVTPAHKAGFLKNAEVVMTPKTKITICPPWRPRFEAVILPFVASANQSGRVLAEDES